MLRPINSSCHNGHVQRFKTSASSELHSNNHTHECKLRFHRSKRHQVHPLRKITTYWLLCDPTSISEIYAKVESTEWNILQGNYPSDNQLEEHKVMRKQNGRCDRSAVKGRGPGSQAETFEQFLIILINLEFTDIIMTKLLNTHR